MSLPATVRVLAFEFRVLNMRTRMPFKYGIASLSALPHLFARAELEVNGRRIHGLTSEGLPPKWFTKDPATPFAADLRDMLAVIRHAATLAVDAGPCASAFDLWHHVSTRQYAWGHGCGFPGLLSGLGTALAERAVIDGVCRAMELPFPRAITANAFGIRLPEIHPELPARSPSEFLPSTPVPAVSVRHTVGLADPLEETDISLSERLDDGLPQSLAASIRQYGLHCFKLKLCGKPDQDLDRLRRIARVLAQAGVERPFWSLDGNEQFSSVSAFREFWGPFDTDPTLASFRRGLLFVEQPIHRTAALSDSTTRELLAWARRPLLIIDESDGEPGAVTAALAGGYAGTSHKNCKGVFRGVANACLLASRREQNPDSRLILSSEDLANVGPIAMLQDLVVAATLGLDHSERNGHHYFRGLSMFEEAVQAATIAGHPSLYERSTQGFATLRIRDGRILTDSVASAPFGYRIAADLSRYTPLDDWSPASLGL